MQPADQGSKIQSNINVTPLVDVVLVLLIIFMVLAPQLHSGPDMQLPTTEEPPQKPETGTQVLVALEHDGKVWIDADEVEPEQFHDSIATVADERENWQVVIKGDARLTFGDVKRAMLAVESVGFDDVGLIAEQRKAN